MTFFLDTDICVFALRGDYPSILQEIQKRTPDKIKIPSIVAAELLVGARKSAASLTAQKAVETFLSPYDIVPFDLAAADAYAAIRSELEEDGVCIGPNDLIIAATALAGRATLVTHNTKEFSRVPGLALQDWTAA
jgi:tRNA(fMet)-specific endonuclease VapC